MAVQERTLHKNDKSETNQPNVEIESLNKLHMLIGGIFMQHLWKSVLPDCSIVRDNTFCANYIDLSWIMHIITSSLL